MTGLPRSETEVDWATTWVESLPIFFWTPLHHFFFVCFAASLFLAIFFRSFGNLVAGILGVLPSFMGYLQYECRHGHSTGLTKKSGATPPAAVSQAAAIFSRCVLVKKSRREAEKAAAAIFHYETRHGHQKWPG